MALSDQFGDFGGRTWLNTAHQGAVPLPAARAAAEAMSWKVSPHELTTERFEAVPRRFRDALAATTVDALVSVGFKWLCGPYGTGFLWLAPHLRERLVPTKAYWLAHLSQRDLARDDLEPVLEPGVRNDFDIFGTANFNTFVPWTVSVEHVLELGVDRIRAHDDDLVERLVAGLDTAGMRVLSNASTLVYFTHEDPARNKELHTHLADAGIDIAFRAGKLRASPHLYNDAGDIDRLLDAVVG